MNTTEFIQAIEDHKVLINGDGDRIFKNESGTIYYFGEGIVSSGTVMQVSEKFEDQISIGRNIEISGGTVFIPIYCVNTRRFGRADA